MKLLSHLYIQVLLGIALGIAFGFWQPQLAEAMQPLATLFIKLVKMLIAPIIFCTVVTGIVHMGDMKKAGRLGIKALIYFELVTTFALILGLLVGNLTGVGRGMNVDPASLDASAVQGYVGQAESQKDQSFMDFLLDIIPHSFLDGVTEGNLLQTLFAAILFAWAMLGMGKPGQRIAAGIDSLSHVFFRIIAIVMRLAPLGAFGAMAYTIGKYGIHTVLELLGFVGLFYATCIGFVLIVLGAILKFTTGLGILPLLRYIRSELIIVLGTSSSETVLPRILDKMQRLGCAREVVGMVVPTGYSFNLDGSSIYFTLAMLFLAHALDIELSLAEQISILLILLFTSKGAAGVTGSAFIVLTGTLTSIESIPVAAAAIILGVDRFMSEARALTNLVGNCVATLVIARWEKALNMSQAKGVLSGKLHPGGDTDVAAITVARPKSKPRKKKPANG